MKKNTEVSINYSIIVPVYCNEGALRKTFKTLYDKVLCSTPGGELIFIDDGSHDNSFEELLEIQQQHPWVKIVKLTRNFGQIAAILCGYEHAEGQCIINISADLQDPPELINEMLKNYFEEHYEIVICHRIDREESLFRKVTSRLFYNFMRVLSFPSMPDGGFDFFLISSKVKQIVLDTHEHNSFLQGQILWTGYPIKEIPYRRKKREIGKSKWTFSKKAKMFIDGTLGYSYLPLRCISFLGALIALSGFLYAGGIVFLKFFGKTPFTGWAPLMILILVLSGIQMVMLGIIGEYLWRTLDQARNRHLYIVEKIYQPAEELLEVLP